MSYRVFLVLVFFFLQATTTQASATPSASLNGLTSSIQFQQVFSEIELGAHKLSSYRVITALDAERLVSEVEAHWRRDPLAKVFKLNSDRAWRLSNVTAFPRLEVLEVSKSNFGGARATFSISSPAELSLGHDEAFLDELLPSGFKLRQRLRSSDRGVEGVTLLALADRTVDASAQWFESRAKSVGFVKNQRVRFDGDATKSYVGAFHRKTESCIVTIDRETSGSAIVLQYTKLRVGK